MYESFFGLTQRPFSVAPRADLYYPAQAVEEARGTLVRIIERAEGPGLLIGAAGTGKSLLLAVLATNFQGRFQVAQLTSTRLCTRRALLQAILYELGLDYREKEEGALRLSLIDHLSADRANPKSMLLLVDEAHQLPLRLLEEIRMITNLVRCGQPCVRLVLAGSRALEERFANPKLESFHQRLAARCYLTGFSAPETAGYVCAQLTACGGDPAAIITDEALALLHRATDGIPRLINQVCDHALVLSFSAGQRQITSERIEEAWADLQQLPLPAASEAGTASRGASVIEFGSLDDAELPAEGEPLASIPFPMQDTAEESSGQIEEKPAVVEHNLRPALISAPDPEPEFDDPLAETFEEEVVVIDRYASLDDEFLRSRPRVSSRAMGLTTSVPSWLADGQRLADTAGHPDGVVARKHVVRATSNAGRILAQSEAPWHQQPNLVPDLAELDPVMPESPENEPLVGSCSIAWNDLANDADHDRGPLAMQRQSPGEATLARTTRRREYRQLFVRLRRTAASRAGVA